MSYGLFFVVTWVILFALFAAIADARDRRHKQRSRLVELLDEQKGILYQLQAGEDFLAGDLAKIDADGFVRKATRDDKIIGIAIDPDHIAMGQHTPQFPRRVVTADEEIMIRASSRFRPYVRSMTARAAAIREGRHPIGILDGVEIWVDNDPPPLLPEKKDSRAAQWFDDAIDGFDDR